MIPALVLAAQAQKLLGIAAAKVRQWAKRGKLFARGLDQHGRPMYAVLDILKLATG
jgi:hypothetical protein